MGKRWRGKEFFTSQDRLDGMSDDECMGMSRIGVSGSLVPESYMLVQFLRETAAR